MKTSDGLFSENTGVIDQVAYLRALEFLILEQETPILKNTYVQNIFLENGKVYIELSDECSVLRVNNIINAAGHGAVHVLNTFRNAFGLPPSDYSDFYVKGAYLELPNKRYSMMPHIYPLPTQYGLGVHLTYDVNGCIKFGPDTSPVDEFDYALPNYFKKKC